MGSVLLLFSILCVAVGTWKLIGYVKEKNPDTNKYLWTAVTSAGIVLFLLLKIFSDP